MSSRFGIGIFLDVRKTLLELDARNASGLLEKQGGTRELAKAA